MNRSGLARYGWMIALLAVGALWLRIESRPAGNAALAAPQGPSAEFTPLKPVTIAVIDIAVIFKNDRKFNKQMTSLKEDIEIFDKHVKEESAALKELGDRIQVAKPDSDHARELTQRAEAQTKALQERVGNKKAELLAAEAEIYFDRYKEIELATRMVARERKIDFVLRYNSEEMKRGDRNSVLQGVNRAIVTYPESHNITDAVVKVLNQS